MIKFLQLALIILLALSCSSRVTKTPDVKAPEVTLPDVTLDPIEVNPDAPVKIMEIKNFKGTSTEKERTFKAVERIRETAQTECFQNGLKAINLIQTNGLTPEQVVQKILSADVKVNIEMYYSIKNVVGYTYPSSDTIWLNKKYHNKWDPCDVGANLFHEATHKMGFTHDYKANKDRPRSVPYATGSVMDKCCVEKR